MENKLIVILDDDPEIVEEICAYLKDERFEAQGFSQVDLFFDFIAKRKPDLVVLDISLPNTSGFKICKTLKDSPTTALTPVIILSGRTEEHNKIYGLDVGADDYVVKPVSLNELGARIRAVLRRQPQSKQAKKVSIGADIVIDPQKFVVTIDGREVELTTAEFKILELLANNKGEVFQRKRILEHLWGNKKDVVERTIDVHIRHLRVKLGRFADLIKNIRGIGYKIQD
jgi:DNA-binding response OmpR family regulator